MVNRKDGQQVERHADRWAAAEGPGCAGLRRAEAAIRRHRSVPAAGTHRSAGRVEAAVERHAPPVCRCCWTGRRCTTLAVHRRVNDLRNSWSKSADGESGFLWEMNVTGKQPPELIERPASLLVPTSASKPAHLDQFGRTFSHRSELSIPVIWAVCGGNYKERTRRFSRWCGSSRLPLKITLFTISFLPNTCEYLPGFEKKHFPNK